MLFTSRHNVGKRSPQFFQVFQPNALTCNQGNCFPGQPQGATNPTQAQAPTILVPQAQNIQGPWFQPVPVWPYGQNGYPVPSPYYPVQQVLPSSQVLPIAPVTQAPVIVNAAPVTQAPVFVNVSPITQAPVIVTVAPAIGSGAVVNKTTNRILDDEDDTRRSDFCIIYHRKLYISFRV